MLPRGSEGIRKESKVNTSEGEHDQRLICIYTNTHKEM